MEQEDITIYYPLLCNGVFETTAYSLLGTINSFSNAIDLFKFIRRSFLTEEECDMQCQFLNALKKT